MSTGPNRALTWAMLFVAFGVLLANFNNYMLRKRFDEFKTYYFRNCVVPSTMFEGTNHKVEVHVPCHTTLYQTPAPAPALTNPDRHLPVPAQ